MTTAARLPVSARPDAPERNNPPADRDDDDALVVERLRTWRAAYRPDSDEAEWLFEVVVVNSVRVDRCQRDEARVRALQALRASLCWEEDRRLAAEVLGRTLARRPSLVVGKLRKTRQGCDWLLARWRGLADLLDRVGEWTEAQTALAFDLLGTPRELRDGLPQPSRDALDREVAGLERLCAEAIDELDDLEREAAERGEPVEPDGPFMRLRRDEAASLRRYQWARNRLKDLRRVPAPEPPPAVVAPETESEPQPAPAPVATQDDGRAYERGSFARALAKAGVTPTAPPETIFDVLRAVPTVALIPAAPAQPDSLGSFQGSAPCMTHNVTPLHSFSVSSAMNDP